jgi:hypothetical protein
MSMARLLLSALLVALLLAVTPASAQRGKPQPPVDGIPRVASIKEADHVRDIFDLQGSTLTVVRHESGALRAISLENPSGVASSVLIDDPNDVNQGTAKTINPEIVVRCIWCLPGPNGNYGILAVYVDGVLVGYIVIQLDGKFEFKVLTK